MPPRTPKGASPAEDVLPVVRSCRLRPALPIGHRRFDEMHNALKRALPATATHVGRFRALVAGDRAKPAPGRTTFKKGAPE